MRSLAFKIYRDLISPLLHLLAGPGFGCRYEPSCSLYAEQAIVRHGWSRGLRFAFRRLLRCHPLSRHPTHDPVP